MDAGSDASMPEVAWFAIYTRPRHEKRVEGQLRQKGIESYLPLCQRLHRWSDRKKLVDVPLFSGYVFFHGDAKDRYDAVRSYGAVRIVTFDGRPAVVRDEEIENIKRILREIPSVESCPDVAVGDPVEIVSGPLTGVQGRIEEVRSERRLLVSIPSVRQALRFNVDGVDVRVLK